MKKILTISAIGLGALIGCAGEDANTEAVPSETADICSKYSDPGKTATIQAQIEQEVDSALDHLNVAFGIADQGTVERVRSEMMLKFANRNIIVSTEPVPENEEFTTLSEGCEDDEKKYGCIDLDEDTLFHPRGIFMDNINKKRKIIGPKIARTLFLATAVPKSEKPYEGQYPEPKPVGLVAQCGSIEIDGTNYEYYHDPVTGKLTEIDVPKQESKIFCSYGPMIDFENPTWEKNETVFGNWEERDGGLSIQSVGMPSNPRYEYGDGEHIKNQVKTINSPTNQEHAIVQRLAKGEEYFDSAISCKSEKQKSFVKKIIEILNNLLKIKKS